MARLGHHKTTTLVSPHMPLSSTEVFWGLFRSLQFEVSSDSKTYSRRRYWFATIHVALEGLGTFVWQLLLLNSLLSLNLRVESLPLFFLFFLLH